jgi:transcriptional regulator
MIDDLSASQEAHLLPKTPWTTDKLTADRLDGLMRAIVGFEVTFDALEGKFKLSQDKRDEDAQGVAAHLEQSPRAGDRETGLAMRSARPG